MNIIVKMRFGSHLYGTNTPDSDLDIKGVFMPTKEQILLGKIPKSYIENTKSSSEVKNANEDVDVELYSLHYFIDLACQGQTVALDMLHAPENMIEEKSYIWDEITSNRKTFYTRNLQSFIGYARKQAAKYGIKGSRLNDAKRVVDFLSNYDPSHRSKIKLSSIWAHLPIGEHIHFIEDSLDGKKQYQVCGKKIQETVTIEYALNIVEKFYKNYGNRAILASQNKNIDWKAISHALRAAYQVKDILTDGAIVFPLRQANFLKEVKNGKLDYKTEVAPLLELLMNEVEELSKVSSLPAKVDRDFWNKFIIKTIQNELFTD